jgi:hypothetical protein
MENGGHQWISARPLTTSTSFVMRSRRSSRSSSISTVTYSLINGDKVSSCHRRHARGQALVPAVGGMVVVLADKLAI